ncbi:hypothetical protein F2Q70_00027686 [Brassica cretica]|uniref:Uncharacterized protein n=1 Tax=Brassica cretica TaxID=69181 RepID=A0A8S9LEW3_BRACR|nr:hypothetical protein F2Q70_00027686 [Brassica cretica]
MFNRRREGACEAGSTSSFSGSSLRHRQVSNVVVSTLGPLLVGGFVRTKLRSEQHGVLKPEAHHPRAALKSTGSSFDLFFTAPCVSFEPGSQQPNGLHLIQPILTIHEELQLGVCG